MGIDRPFISLIEVGRKQPTISVLYALAAALELRLEEFAGRIDNRYSKASKVAERSRRSPKA